MSNTMQWVKARPIIKDFFGENATLQQVADTYLSQPELFKYAQALDNYIDKLLSGSAWQAGQGMREALEEMVFCFSNMPHIEEEKKAIEKAKAALSGGSDGVEKKD